MTEQQAREALGIQSDASSEEVRRAYLRAVRAHPPERDPVGFQRVREAYDLLRGLARWPAFSLQLETEHDRSAPLAADGPDVPPLADLQAPDPVVSSAPSAPSAAATDAMASRRPAEVPGGPIERLLALEEEVDLKEREARAADLLARGELASLAPIVLGRHLADLGLQALCLRVLKDAAAAADFDATMELLSLEPRLVSDTQVLELVRPNVSPQDRTAIASELVRRGYTADAMQVLAPLWVSPSEVDAALVSMLPWLIFDFWGAGAPADARALTAQLERVLRETGTELRLFAGGGASTQALLAVRELGALPEDFPGDLRAAIARSLATREFLVGSPAVVEAAGKDRAAARRAHQTLGRFPFLDATFAGPLLPPGIRPQASAVYNRSQPAPRTSDGSRPAPPTARAKIPIGLAGPALMAVMAIVRALSSATSTSHLDVDQGYARARPRPAWLESSTIGTSLCSASGSEVCLLSIQVDHALRDANCVDAQELQRRLLGVIAREQHASAARLGARVQALCGTQGSESAPDADADAGAADSVDASFTPRPRGPRRFRTRGAPP